MSEDARGMPLDLRAVGMEADLTRTMPEEAPYGGPWQDAALRHADTIDRLLTHVRALRVALMDLLRETTHRGDCAPLGCTACQAFARATAVLARAQDGPA